MRLDKDTVVCISVAARPGNLGTVVHNAAFAATGLNFIYKAFRVSDIAAAMAGVRTFGIRGCGVSMPFKEAVIPHLDKLDASAAEIGAVNTVVNEDGQLTGFNTDVHGARRALADVTGLAAKRTVLLGAGGVAKAIAYALREMGAKDVVVSGRTPRKADDLAAAFGYRTIPWAARSRTPADVVINATSIGMAPDDDECPVDEGMLADCATVMDVVVAPILTRLIRAADALGKEVIPGYRMSLHQAAMQFQLYTGLEPPLAAMERALLESLGASGVA